MENKSALEIYGEHFSRMNPDGSEYRTDEDIENAMDEYAMQFANWLLRKQTESQGVLIAFTTNDETINKYKNEINEKAKS